MEFTTLIDSGSLRALLAQTDTTAGRTGLVLLDCRFDLAVPAAGRQAYLRAHIPGARYADLNLELAAPVSATSGRHPLPPPEVLARRCAAFGIDHPDVQVVAYDAANGAFAARAWWLLRWLGHRRVAVLDGGYQAWLADGGAPQSETASTMEASGAQPAAPTTDSSVQAFVTGARVARTDSSVDEPVTATHPTHTANTASVLSTAEVLRALGESSRLLVDARAAERYAGEVEPIDPVAGHVPGAVNHPFIDNLAANGRFLPQAELRRRWQATLAGHAPGDTILMCGSGVTACHDLLALEIAGLPGAALYAGSWSEWIRDPERPVARGKQP